MVDETCEVGTGLKDLSGLLGSSLCLIFERGLYIDWERLLACYYLHAYERCRRYALGDGCFHDVCQSFGHYVC